ncbi:hypothetical protein [Anatilimnocola floriformis]|uniref:hypothetical protein n=1 Tax=Anatilimnocola floriformis TaxID=2948575 RepID=UPI0020C581AA|nr:hypothetical protein [Anatilimnocola floriformis]
MTAPISFIVSFVGGPLNATQLFATQEIEFPIFIGRLVGGSPTEMAIYEYDGNQEGDRCMQRIYLYVETLGMDEGAEFIAEHGRIGGEGRAPVRCRVSAPAQP